MPAGDATKNGRGDFNVGTSAYPIGLVEGAAVLASNGTLTVSSVASRYDYGGTVAGYGSLDFDGDGWSDLAQGRFVDSAHTLGFMLSRDWDANATMATPSLGSSLINRPMIAHGDFNGDGFDDAVLSEGTLNTIGNSDWTGRVQILHGHIPLRNPTLQLAAAAPGSPWATATLSVEGRPTEMMFTGDVSPALTGRWVPFAPTMRLELDGGFGDKTVRVTFRNAQRKTSDEAVAVTTLSAGAAPDVQAYRNRVRAGASARWDVSLPSGGRLRARVYGAGGGDIRTLVDDTYAAGVWPVEWDGRNAAGAPTAPGQYRVRIEAAGATHLRDVVVER